MAASVDVGSAYSGNFTSSDSWSHGGGGSETGILVIVLQAHNVSDVVETISVTHGGNSVPAVTDFPWDATLFDAFSGMTMHAFWDAGSIAQGTQAVAVTKSGANPCLAMAITINTASGDPEIDVTDRDIDSDGEANPSGSISITGSIDTLVLAAFCSGQDDDASVVPISGWTQQAHADAGTLVSEIHSYDTVGTTSPITYGYTAANDASLGAAFAIIEPASADVTGSGTPSVPSVTMSGSGNVSASSPNVTGSGTPSVPAVTMSGTGNVAEPSGDPAVFSVGGAQNLVMPSVTMDGAGSNALQGSGTPVFPSITMSGVGLAVTSITGSGTPSFPLITVSGTGQVVTPGLVTGTGALTMPSVTMFGQDVPPWGDGPFLTEVDWRRYRKRKLRKLRGL